MIERLRLAWGVLGAGARQLGDGLAPWGRGWRWELLLGVLVFVLLAYSRMFPEISVPNERSRAYLTVAIVDDGTLSIDQPLDRFGAILDRSLRDGRYYTDKAPGMSLLGVVPYWLARRFTAAEDWSVDDVINLMRTWLMLPITLLGFFWMRRFLRRLEFEPSAVDVTSLAWTLGTSAFHYGTAFYGHQVVAVCLLGSLDLIHAAETTEPGWSRIHLRLLGAGALAGMAGLTEYQAGIPAALLLLYVVVAFVPRRPLTLAPFVLGAVPFAVLLFGYDTLAFGGPFELSYGYLAHPVLQEIHGHGIAGVTVPEWQYALGGFLSLDRGLFSTSPIFLLSIPGLVFMWREGLRRMAVLIGVGMLYFGLFISGTEMWYAGWGFGPRLLVPMMGWAMLPVAFCLRRAARRLTTDGLACGLALAGIAYHQVVHGVFPELPEDATNPVVDVVLPVLNAGTVSPNLANGLLGWQGVRSLLPLFALVLLAGAAILRGAAEGRTRDERVARVFVALVPLLLLALLILIAGQGWTGPEQDGFLRWLGKLGAGGE
ncbi:MAG: hypothetical protein HY905_09545 [Deltaproteobacteria bacterium]|nr:hypothetical protein [Deltaproteobacteria bacterium]